MVVGAALVAALLPYISSIRTFYGLYPAMRVDLHFTDNQLFMVMVVKLIHTPA